MRAEHLKGWLLGMRKEEESEGANTTAGDKWRALTKLVQTVWDKGRIPPQLGWVIIVLLPKGGGAYRGIGLLEPIWKVVERVMDRRLETIVLVSIYVAEGTLRPHFLLLSSHAFHDGDRSPTSVNPDDKHTNLNT